MNALSSPDRRTPIGRSRRHLLAGVAAGLLATGPAGTLVAQVLPGIPPNARRPGDGVPVSRPDSQGTTRTWSRLPPAALVAALRAGGLVLLFRHGRTDWRTADQLPQTRFDDRRTQRNLSDEGREQGRRTGELFATLGVRFDPVLSSPYFRARDFAELVAGRPAEVTRKLLGYDRVGLDGHRELLSQRPPAGRNALLSGHQFAVTELGHVRMNELEEGSCLVFRPQDDGRTELIAHLNHADLLALASAG